jgi:hypothetical protein
MDLGLDMKPPSESDSMPMLEAIEMLRKIIASEQHLIAGCRYLCRFKYSCPVKDSEIWNPIIGFESETDDYPMGALRERYSAAYLQKLDSEIDEYIKTSMPVIIRSCEKLLAALMQRME